MTVGLCLSYSWHILEPNRLTFTTHRAMAHRSIFNDPSPANSDSGEQDTDSGPQALDQTEPPDQAESSDQAGSDGDPPDDELDDDELDDDELGDDEECEDGDNEEGPNHLGDHEDTYTTIRPYLGVLASLDRDHNTSLSKHLYSAHLLRRRNSRAVATSSTASGSDSDSAEPRPEKKRQKRTELVTDSEEDDDGYQFGRGRRFLTKQWTSWPHPPSYVPRETDPKISRLKSQPRVFHFDPGTYERSLNSKNEKPASSQMLEETLVATFLRFSGDKFRSRPAKETKGMTLALDDDVSRQFLKPVVRHIISQLDGLLRGLYHERGYAKTLIMEDRESMRKSKYVRDKTKGIPWVERRRLKRTAKSTTDTEDEDEDEDGDGDEDGDDEDGEDEDGEDDEDEDGKDDEDEDSTKERDSDNDGKGTPPKKARRVRKSKSTHRRHPATALLAKKYCIKRHNKLRLRDWSQVLGIAAFTGWEEDTLQRTMKRCEEQFDQTMSWRRLKESDPTTEVGQGEMWTGARLKRPRGEDEDNDGISKDGFLQPVNIRMVDRAGKTRCIIGGPPKKEKPRVGRGDRRVSRA